jgi:Cdc6-like AAA superfamily ATPase
MTALIGRENEFRAIEDHVKGWLGEGNSECLFVNGVPGTGKTATVSQVVKKLQEQNNPPPTKGKTTKRKTKDAVREYSTELTEQYF